MKTIFYDKKIEYDGNKNVNVVPSLYGINSAHYLNGMIKWKWIL